VLVRLGIALGGRNRMNASSIEGAVSFAERLATSESFKSLFREGMALVEETAAYLDGGGREEAKKLSRIGALAYATESMRLTTRLMQIASWLLLQRAVNDGELTQSEAATEKRKVRLSEQAVSTGPDVYAKLPPRLVAIIERSLRLQTRIFHLDRLIHPSIQKATPDTAARPLEPQLELLRAAFVLSE
jgi:regulator of CtrA degradation